MAKATINRYSYLGTQRRVHTLGVPGCIPEIMAKSTRLGTRVSQRRVYTPGIPGYISEYDQKVPGLVPVCISIRVHILWGYPGIYPSMTKTNRFDTRVSRVYTLLNAPFPNSTFFSLPERDDTSNRHHDNRVDSLPQTS